MPQEKTELEKLAVEIVAGQIINMLTNNILEDNGTESFMGWLEDGDAFDDELSEEELDACIELAKKVAPLVDELTFNHLNFGY